jgi:uncharacterized membrane protein YhaH (DUF805 family)
VERPDDPARPPAPSAIERLRRAPALWFSLRMPVRRLEYAASGLFLSAVKFALDGAIYRAGTGRPWSWTSYLNPSFTWRFGNSLGVDDWVVWALAVVMLPFLWVGVSMTARRCLDAGLSPAWSFLFFVPALNYVFLALLCGLPSRPYTVEVGRWTRQRAAVDPASWLRLFYAVGWGVGIGLAMLVVSVALLERYGLALFVGAPFAIGAVSAFVYNRGELHSFWRTVGTAQVALLAASLAVLLFALEGLLCLVMACPIAVVTTLLGATLGYAVARSGEREARSLGGLVLALPALLVRDAAAPPPLERVVTTAVEIDAPPEVVWPHVIDFPPLAPPTEWLFRTGVAFPTAARLEGHGVGAVRHCEFSTGAFVEPITVWEPPLRLGFDVIAQPPPLREISPYSRVFAPHLVDGLRSRRGEFRLVWLPGGRTRLEGRTWYTLELRPQAYWAPWADSIIGRIHGRVLEHVRGLASAG